MSVMAKAPKKPKRSGKPLHVWIDAALRDALEGIRKRHRRKLRDEVSVALEDYLSRHGAWPPPDASASP